MSIKSEDWERLLKPNGVVIDIKSIFEKVISLILVIGIGHFRTIIGENSCYW